MNIIGDPLFLKALLSSIFICIYFFCALFISFFIPGNVILGKLAHEFKSKFERIILSFGVGLVFWAYQGMIFGYFQLRDLSYLYLLFFAFLWVKRNLSSIKLINFLPMKKIKINLFSFFIALIFFFGILGQWLKFFIAGLKLSQGIYMLAVSSDDQMYHLGLTSQIVKRFPPFEPGLVNVHVANYHYWGNLVIGELVRVFRLPLLQTQYQYSYLFISFLLGAAAFVLAKLLKFNKIGIVLFVYFFYFASDTIYLFTLVIRHVFDFSIGFIDGGVELLENPPRAFAYVVGIFCIILLQIWLRKKDWRSGILLAFFLSSLIGFKINNGIVFILGFIGMGLFLVVRKEFRVIPITILTGILSLIIYLPVNSGATGLLFTPFWMTRDFVAQPGIKLVNLELARRIYAEHSNVLQALRMDLTMLVFFLLAQFGIKTIGFIPLKSMFYAWKLPFMVFLYIAIFSGVILGTFFYQSTGGGNIFNFYLVSGILLPLPATFVLSSLIRKNRIIGIIVILLIVLLTLPRWIERTGITFTQYTARPTISQEQVEAMDFVKAHTHKSDIMLVFNQGTWDSEYPYISGFTERDMFLSGQGILRSHKISYKLHEEIRNTIQKSKSSQEVSRLLTENHIKILYFFGEPKMGGGLKKLRPLLIFKNKDISIYQV